MVVSTIPYTTLFEPHLAAIQGSLETLLTPREPEVLWSAMRHGVLNGGKRIRPTLLIECCLASGGTLENALPTATALELIHCYSLIHDDLPCIDNDDLRRGRPTVHKAFGEDIAVLAGDALLAMSFGLVADQTRGVPESNLLRVITELSRVASTQGLVNGQVEDITSAHKTADEALLKRIHAGKTGALFRFSTWAGAMLAGQPQSIVDPLARFGETLGLTFQIVDDLLDIRASGDVLGKTPGKDQAQGKMTFPAVYGVAGAEAILASERQALYDILTGLSPGVQTDKLKVLVDFVTKREF